MTIADSAAIVSIRLADDTEVRRSLTEVSATDIARAVPWRMVRSARGQLHYPGYYWAATTGCHVIYESRLELARLLLADFAADVVAIIAQPFRVEARVDGRARWHVPDFVLVHEDHAVQVVNVKPAHKLSDPDVVKALAWPGGLIQDHGWGYEIWSGDDPVLLANLRFLAGYRRPGILPSRLLDTTYAAIRSGETLGSLESRMKSHDEVGVRAAVLRMLWEHRLITDLWRPLSTHSPLGHGRFKIMKLAREL